MRVRVLLALAGLLTLACASNRGCQRGTQAYDRGQVADALDRPEGEVDAGLILGMFPIAPGGVVDGDTIKVGGLDASLRLLGIDTEETFKSEKDLRLYESGWDEYYAKKQADTERPVKCATPMGMEAKEFAEEYFRRVTQVRIERDHVKEVKGRYARYLAYVFVERDGEWENYNVETVRAGMSPYFTKYSFSRRFHDEFVEAQQEARAAQRGIWDPGKEHYRDYPQRLKWWDARARFIEQFEREAEGRDDYIILTHWDALDRLQRLEGAEVTLLGGVGSIREPKGSAPTRVLLARRMFSDFPLIFFDEDVVARSRVEDASGEFLRVRGTVTKYTFKGKRGRKGNEQLQIVVRIPEQIQIAETGALAKVDTSALIEEPPGPELPEPTFPPDPVEKQPEEQIPATQDEETDVQEDAQLEPPPAPAPPPPPPPN